MSDKMSDKANKRDAGRPAMPLPLATIGQQVELASIEGGSGLVHRMAEMGLTPGVRFTVVTKGQPGPMIISLKDTRLVIGKGMVHRILVYPL